jgi:hypothetical protein
MSMAIPIAIQIVCSVHIHHELKEISEAGRELRHHTKAV